MKKRIAMGCVWLVGLWVTAGAWADKEGLWGQPDQRTILRGTMGEDLEIMVDLSVYDTESEEDTEPTLRGHYVYRCIGEPIELTGRRAYRDGQARLELTESVDGEVAGRWELVCEFSGTEDDAPAPPWVGTWTQADGAASQPVRLELVAEFELGRRAIGGLTVEWAFPIPVVDPAAYETLLPIFADHRERLSEYFTDAMVPRVQSNDFRADRLRNRRRWYGLNSTVTWWSDDAICLLLDTYTYGGGAHSNFRFDTVLLVCEEGAFREVVVDDVFADPADIEATLSPLVVAGLIEQGWTHRMSGRADRVFSAKDILYFTVSAKGLTVYFEPYAIASYAEGAFVVTVPWDALMDVIDPEGPLGRWAETAD